MYQCIHCQNEAEFDSNTCVHCYVPEGRHNRKYSTVEVDAELERLEAEHKVAWEWFINRPG